MSQLADIKAAQEDLEASFTKRMAELEAQLNTGGPAKDTVAKVAEEFRTFRELMFKMLGLLRRQINECSRVVDVIETRNRRNALIFLGVAESETEDCKSVVMKTVHNMELPNVSTTNINICHRLGAPSRDHHRPILVWFSSTDIRSAVWRAKTRLKGTSVSVKEFLTKTRQAVFSKARQHFGMRACWTQEGVVVVKVSNGTRHKIATIDELNALMSKFPRSYSSADKTGDVSAGTSNANSKPRK